LRSAGTFTHKRAAEKAAIVAEDEARKLGWRDPDAAGRSWGEWCAEWWPTRSVEQSTLVRDESRRDFRLMPRWKDVPLAAISRQDVRAWAAELAASGLAPSTVQRCVHLLSASLSAAVDAEILDVNAAQRLKLTVGQRLKERYLAEDEQAALLEQFEEGSVHRALVALLLGTGMRWGEAAGLQVKRVDFRRGRVRIAEVWDDRNRALKAYPKGRQARDVPLPSWVEQEIAPHLQGRAGHALTLNGSVLDYHNWRSRWWAPALERAEIGELTIHDLRHTYASMLIQRGVSLAEVGRLLGHKSPQTTQRYAHLAETDDAQVREALPRPARGADVEQTAATRDYNVLQFRPRQRG
ncbi:MAG TPA: site-specific integrase, partial [Naasia sp.]